MAADLHLLQAAQPAFRLYGWDPPCLSLGKLQKADWVDHDLLARHGLGLVRRPSGGRALLHDQELTYSLVLPGAGRLRLETAFQAITSALGEALRRLGVPVTSAGDEFRAPPSRTHPGCHAIARPGELITSDGVKLVGSAQVRRGDTLLQHGSIPWKVRWELVELLLPGSPVGTDLSRMDLGPVDPAALAEALGEVLGVEWVEEPWTTEERSVLEEAVGRESDRSSAAS